MKTIFVTVFEVDNPVYPFRVEYLCNGFHILYGEWRNQGIAQDMAAQFVNAGQDRMMVTPERFTELQAERK